MTIRTPHQLRLHKTGGVIKNQFLPTSRTLFDNLCHHAASTYLTLMKIKLITFTREDDKNVNALFDLYARRLKHYTSFEYLNIRPEKSADPVSQKKKDAEMLLKKTEDTATLILLDERGEEMNSLQLAGFIAGKMNAAIKSLQFVIGGSYGFDQRVYDRCNGMISLSKFTLPHQLAKVLVAEQLYRAFTIIRNEKYHHGE